MDLLTTRYSQNLAGVLSCYDRIVITGTLPGACYAGGMTSFLYSRGIRIFDYARFAEPLRERIRERAQALATEHGAHDRTHRQGPHPQGRAWWPRCWPRAAMRRGWCT